MQKWRSSQWEEALKWQHIDFFVTSTGNKYFFTKSGQHISDTGCLARRYKAEVTNSSGYIWIHDNSFSLQNFNWHSKYPNHYCAQYPFTNYGMHCQWHCLPSVTLQLTILNDAWRWWSTHATDINISKQSNICLFVQLDPWYVTGWPERLRLTWGLKPPIWTIYSCGTVKLDTRLYENTWKSSSSRIDIKHIPKCTLLYSSIRLGMLLGHH